MHRCVQHQLRKLQVDDGLLPFSFILESDDIFNDHTAIIYFTLLPEHCPGLKYAIENIAVVYHFPSDYPFSAPRVYIIIETLPYLKHELLNSCNMIETCTYVPGVHDIKNFLLNAFLVVIEALQKDDGELLDIYHASELLDIYHASADTGDTGNAVTPEDQIKTKVI